MRTSISTADAAGSEAAGSSEATIATAGTHMQSDATRDATRPPSPGSTAFGPRATIRAPSGKTSEESPPVAPEMATDEAILQVDLPGVKFVRRGKVRDIFD